MQMSKLFISFSNSKGVKLIPSKEYYLDTTDTIIYTIYLPHFIGLKSDLAEFLNAEELSRAERFHKELDQNRFIICRSVLKLVLAAHSKIDIKKIRIDYHSNKKPYLASHPWLYFNVSHSEDFAIIAISRNKVGIDIENISENFDYSNLLAIIFDDNEIVEIENAVNKKQAFYTLWTRKEAFVKALGKGIDEDFKYIPCLDGQHNIDSTLLKTTENWQMYSFNLEDHYLGAVAFEGLPTITPNLAIYTIPNSMKVLIEMAQS